MKRKRGKKGTGQPLPPELGEVQAGAFAAPPPLFVSLVACGHFAGEDDGARYTNFVENGMRCHRDFVTCEREVSEELQEAIHTAAYTPGSVLMAKREQAIRDIEQFAQ